MTGLLDAALANPWSTLDTMLEGPLHPGGADATAELLDRADVGPGTRVLDVGCGAGEALPVARDRGADAVGVDPSPDADRAIRGYATALPLGESRVDVVLAECVLCLTDLPTALGEARRVLAPDGVAVVSFTNRMFPTKAIRAWRAAGMDDRVELVSSYCAAGGLAVADVVRDRPEADPFVAVIARPE